MAQHIADHRYRFFYQWRYPKPDPPPLIDNDEVRVTKWDPIPKTLAQSDRPRLILSIRSQYREFLYAGMTPVTQPHLTSGASYLPHTLIPETVIDIIVKKPGDAARFAALQEFNSVKQQWEWKGALNPSKTDPKHFTFDNLVGDAFELDLRVAAGESTPLYERSMNRVLVYMTDQNVRVTDGAGKVTTVQHKAGDVEWAGPARQSETNLGKDFYPARQSPPSISPAAASAPAGSTQSEQTESGKQLRKGRHGRARKEHNE